MKNIFYCLLFLIPVPLFAQLVSGCAFLKGQFLEIGVNPNGSFGTYIAAPGGYHPHGYSGIGEVYDYGHDGWTTGTPPFMGDYTLQGTPFEGWYLQLDTVMYSAVADYPTTFGGSGSIVSYSRYGGTAHADWSGTDATGNVLIDTKVRLDTYASWVIVDVTLRNIGTTDIPNVYYARACDPDNNQSWGGSFSTTLKLTYQLDPVHGTLVSNYTYMPYSYLGLGTKYRQAKGWGWPASYAGYTGDLASLYAAAPATSTGGSTGVTGDGATGLYFKLDTLFAGTSKTISYAYIFSDTFMIDSIFHSTITARHDSFEVEVTKYCPGPILNDYTGHYVAGSTIKTFFGDGYVDSATVTPGYGSGIAAFSHIYALSGTYTLKQYLYYGSTAVDSLHLSYHHVRCTTIPVRFYYDLNTNCNKDAGEGYFFMPLEVEVDSNGIAVDTISCTSGFYYNALGAPGDIYQFQFLSHPTGFSVLCPSSGVICDTISPGIFGSPIHYVGLTCDTTSIFDLVVHPPVISSSRGVQTFGIYVANTYCPSTEGTLTVNNSALYSYDTAIPAPIAITATSVTWKLDSLSSFLDSIPRYVWLRLYAPSMLTIGDTVISSGIITPFAGDCDTISNVFTDTAIATGSWDPNNITVSPNANIASGAKLRYTINFENTGNDTAFNIHIMDTLTNDLDISSYRMIMASHNMFISKLNDGAGRTVLRFDFPDINLLDSSHHGKCDGMVMFEINSKTGLPDCQHIPNRAGIYFDVNDVVMTNTVDNVIGCLPIVVKVNEALAGNIEVFPNPANNILQLKFPVGAISGYSIINTVGKVVMTGEIISTTYKFDISSLIPGFYIIELRGKDGVIKRKFVKR